jgi:carbamoyl-phosphate synthase large subunit
VQRVVEHTYLASIHSKDPHGGIVIQEALQGEEYGVDVVNDLDGEFVCCFVKRKLGMRFGETDAAITVEDGQIEDQARRIAARLRHVGPMDIDVFRHEDRIQLLDMTPRFGGHYPFAHLAGANVPAALLAWARGEEADPEWLRVRYGVEGYKEIVPALVEPRQA